MSCVICADCCSEFPRGFLSSESHDEIFRTIGSVILVSVGFFIELLLLFGVLCRKVRKFISSCVQVAFEYFFRPGLSDHPLALLLGLRDHVLHRIGRGADFNESCQSGRGRRFPRLLPLGAAALLHVAGILRYGGAKGKQGSRPGTRRRRRRRRTVSGQSSTF